jgi:hypothetical protein
MNIIMFDFIMYRYNKYGVKKVKIFLYHEFII